MSYSTPTDIRNALAPGVWPAPYPENPPVTRTAADLTDAQLNDEIAEADQLIDSYLNSRYATPVAGTVEGETTTYPPPIRTWSRNIAAYKATLTNRRGKDITENDPVVRRYRETMAALIAVSTGKASLNLPGNTGPSGGGDAGAPFNPYTGDLFGSADFDLRPVNPAWPYYPDVPTSFPGGNWR